MITQCLNEDFDIGGYISFWCEMPKVERPKDFGRSLVVLWFCHTENDKCFSSLQWLADTQINESALWISGIKKIYRVIYGSDGKEFVLSVGDWSSIPGLGRFPREGNGNPLQCSCLENSTDRGDWQATDNGVAESNMTWRLTHTLYAAAAKLLQSCPTLCDPIDGSPPSSTIREILQARILEWVAISFSNVWKWNRSVEPDS